MPSITGTESRWRKLTLALYLPALGLKTRKKSIKKILVRLFDSYERASVNTLVICVLRAQWHVVCKVSCPQNAQQGGKRSVFTGQKDNHYSSKESWLQPESTAVGTQKDNKCCPHATKRHGAATEKGVRQATNYLKRNFVL